MTISTEPKVHFWRPAAWLRVSGPDAGVFLQGQFTNDLGALKTSPAVYGLWLNQKGRVLADSFVLRGNTTEEFWVGSYFGRRTEITFDGGVLGRKLFLSGGRDPRAFGKLHHRRRC